MRLSNSVYLLTFFLTSCQFYSKVNEPSVDLVNQYNQKLDDLAFNKVTPFFEQFKDPILVDLVKKVVSSNLDLKEAIEKVVEAEDFYGVVKSQDYPSVEIDMDAQRTRSSKSGFSEIQGVPFGIGVGQNKSIVTNIFLAAANVNWELDFFGKIRNSKKRAQSLIDQIEAVKRGLELSLVADCAITYFAFNSYGQLISLTQENLNNLNELFSLRKSLFAEGLNPDQAVLEIEKRIYQQTQELNDLIKAQSVFFNHLAQLLGKSSLELSNENITFQYKEYDQFFCNVLLPMQLIKNRPDLIIAEKKLIEAGYSVKVALADFFPSLSLLGAFGYASPLATTWFTKTNSFWSIGPTLRWPAFQGFQFLYQYRVAKSQERQALLSYESTVYKALEDVENALVTFFNQDKISKEAFLALDREQKIYQAQKSLNQAGLRSMEIVLEENIVLLSEKKKAILEQFKTVQSLINLYKAIGGEWK